MTDLRSPNSKPPIGVSYSRISDRYHQSGGDGLNRQARDYRDFCQRHGLQPIAEKFLDQMSGFKGKHREKGELGRLIDMAKEGVFEPGTVIVVEAWDRLGRQRVDRQLALVSELLCTGVRIGVCR